MAENKRYYWLKLKDDFFTSKRIKKLRNMAGGDTYLIIYLKMQLLALKTDGVLTWTGVEEDFVDELALDLDEKPDDVRMTVMYLLSKGLAETQDNTSFFLPYVIENTGSETSAAERMRKYRERNEVALERNNVTPALQERYTEKEIEIDTDIEIESESKPAKPAAHAHGEYGWVKLTDAQYQKLVADLGQEELDRCIQYIDESAQSTGNKNKWKDWNLTIRKCSRDGWGLREKRQESRNTPAACRPMPTADPNDLWRRVNMI